MAHSISTPASHAPSLTGFATGLRSMAKTAVRRMQLARMTTLLRNMDDTQLHQIGITRAQIDGYARSLVDGDTDN